MRRRRKYIVIIPAVFAVAALVAIFYIRALDYAVSARTALIGEVERATGKKVFFRLARFGLVRGMVLERLTIYGDKAVILSSEEVSCGLLIPSMASKRIIIPSIRIDGPVIYSERREDGSLSIFDLIPKGYTPKGGVPISIHRIVVRNGRVDFVDRALKSAFTGRARGLNAEIKLYLPVRVTFAAAFFVPGVSGAVTLSGEYIVPAREFVCDVAAENIALKEFLPYYRDIGITFPSGSVDARSSVRWKDSVMEAAVRAKTKDLLAARDTVRSRLDSVIDARIRYDAPSKKAACSGTMDIGSMDIFGLEEIGQVRNIRARVEFTDERAHAEDLGAEALGIPWSARINIVNFKAPVLDIYCRSSVRLSTLQEALATHLKMLFPTAIAGKGELDLSIQMVPDRPAKVLGTLGVEDATVSMGSGNFPIERLAGKFKFTPDEAMWSGLRCLYRGVAYSASGRLVNFRAPRVSLSVSSKDLSYASEMAIDGKVIRLSKLKGRFLNSDLTASGEISLGDPAAIDADLKGAVGFDLDDLKSLSAEFAGVRKMKPDGRLRAEFALDGDLKDIKTCYIDARMKSENLSLCNLKFTGLSLEYLQEQGVGLIKSMRSSFYGGTLTGSARIDWLARAVPFSVKADATGVRLDNLKEAAGFSDRDVSGTLKIYADIRGYAKDPSRIDGLGHLSISGGRLWQLDLFKGAGSLIFSSDFSDIVFTEGKFDYKVADRMFYFDNFVMKSDQLNLYGRGRIGFDRSVSGVLRPEIKEAAVSDGTTGTIARAIGKGTVIEIDGTLKDPRFRTRTNVVDVVGAMLSGRE